LGDEDRDAIKALIGDSIVKVLQYCKKPKSSDEIFEEIGLYKNTKNHNHHIKPLLKLVGYSQTIPDKPTSKNQKYYTTNLGKKLLDIIS
jgi:ATP-dependent DNA helicase RecG